MSWLQRLIQWIADANQKEFGNKRLDCCDGTLHQEQKKPSK